MDTQKVYKFWTHSCHVDNGVDEAIVVKEKVAIPDGSGGYRFEGRLNVIENPKRTFYIHQERYRNYKYKIEYVDKEQCDEYVCKNRDLEREVKNKLGIYSNKRMLLRELCDSPYLYGADVNIEVLVKIRYMNGTKEANILPKYTFGSIDLEVSVLGDGQIILASYCYDGVVYCAILDSFLYKVVPNEFDEQGNPKRVKATLDDVKEVVQKEISDYLERFHLKVEYKVCHSEMELIDWTLKKIHESKADFCGVWNMPYDIPKIIERIKANGKDPVDYMCHPDVPKKYRKVRYAPDYSPTDHFTDSWDWFNCPGHTQYIDSLRLYSRLRKVKGREPSYRLGFISMKEIKHGKLDLDGTHYHNQLYNFLYYTAYNIVDAGNVWLMEQQNGDVSNMTQLVGNSLLKDFSKQTVMLKNDFYQYCIERGKISGTVGNHMGTPFDDLMGKAGGTVLPPYLAKNMGLQCIKERPTLHTLVNIFIKDIDASSMYPNTMIGFNISKETTLATMVLLPGRPLEDIEELFTGMIAPVENAFLIGHKFFDLPSPSELLTEYNEFLKWCADGPKNKEEILEFLERGGDYHVSSIEEVKQLEIAA